MNEWQSKELAEEYAAKATNPKAGWYEHEVNFPDLVRLIPDNAKSVMDFGCGSAEFTAELSKNYKVVGVDMAAMLSIAKGNQPDVDFVEWDGFLDIPTSLNTYDVIFSKLVVQFIEDLDSLLNNFKQILNPSGHVLISVPNPPRIAEKFQLDPTMVSKYDDEVGETGIKINPIYRPQTEYEAIFYRNGYSLIEASTPGIAGTIAEKYELNDRQASDTKRLNLLFQLAS